MPKHLSVTEAHSLTGEGAIYVDVRSSREFAQGHPAGAYNVPLLEPDEETGQMQPNPDFMRVMKANFPGDTRLLIGCQAGGRSMRAAQVLESFGFTDVSNVRGGFSGGNADPGWAQSGLPVEAAAESGRSYADLATKADHAE